MRFLYWYSPSHWNKNLKISFEDILREKCPNTEFFLVLFSCIWTEYKELRIQEKIGIQSGYRKIRTRKNSVLEQFSRSDSYGMTTMMTILSTLLSLNILVGTKLMPMLLSNLKDIKLKNINHVVIAQLNINSLWNKFDFLKETVTGYVDIPLITEIKLDNSFPTAQFQINGFNSPYLLNSNAHSGGGILLYVREDNPSKLEKGHILKEI